MATKFVTNTRCSDGRADFLYHFGFGNADRTLPSDFGDVKFVLCGGSAERIAHYAQYFEARYSQPSDTTTAKVNLANSTRYAMYKVGPILFVSHGMGGPSMSIMLTELLKLLHHAKCRDVTIIRLGTCGGLGMEPGTVVVSTGVVNGLLKPVYVQHTLGNLVERPCVVSADLANELYAMRTKFDYPLAQGLTMCADDFYEGQARLDGAFCDYSETEKMDFLHKLFDKGVRNIEMESACFAATLARADVHCAFDVRAAQPVGGRSGAVVAVALLDRLREDQIDASPEQLFVWEERPCQLAFELIKSRIPLFR